MKDINFRAIMYASSNPYNFTRIINPDSKDKVWYRFQITQQPDPMIAVILGDFIHNLRSALDYIVVASVPKKYRYDISFPISSKDIFFKDKSGEFVVNDSLGYKFNKAFRSMHSQARAIIVGSQLDNFSNPIMNILGIMSRLENADKHRQLSAIGCGGSYSTWEFSINGVPLNRSVRLLDGIDVSDFSYCLEDNTIIPIVLPYNSIDGIPSHMDVHFHTTALILVKVSRIGEHFPSDYIMVNEFMNMALSKVQRILLDMENFVII